MDGKCIICENKVLAKGLCSKHYQSSRRSMAEGKKKTGIKEELIAAIRQVVAEEIKKLAGEFKPVSRVSRKKPSTQELDTPLSSDLEQVIDGETVILGTVIPEPCIRSARWQVLTGWAKKDGIPPDVWSLAHGRSVSWYDPLYHPVRKQNRAIEGKSKVKAVAAPKELSLEELNLYASYCSE